MLTDSEKSPSATLLPLDNSSHHNIGVVVVRWSLIYGGQYKVVLVCYR